MAQSQIYIPPEFETASPREQALGRYHILHLEAEKRGESHRLATMAHLGKTDLFYFFMFVIKAHSWANNDWCFERCREVQAAPDGYIDLWAREHYKSSIITFALTMQDLINDPTLSIGIFSFTKPIAKAFLRQIKYEFESNETLKMLYPDVCWQKPNTQAPTWSEDAGIVLKRKSNQKEASVEANGLTDGMPTSKHYDVLLYDDVVTDTSVNTPEMIQKTTNAFSMSDNLGKEGGKTRIVGTPYADNDTYQWIIDRKIATPRMYPATKDGTPTGELVLFSPEYYAQKRKNQTTYNFNCQILLKPKVEDAAGFLPSWWKTWPGTNTENLNLYIIVDPAQSKSKGAGNTAMWLLGYGPDKNFYVVDFVRDKLSLTEKTDIIFSWHSDHQVQKAGTFYEKVAMQSDIEHILDRQERENFRFDVIPLSPKSRNKKKRIEALEPLLRDGRIFFLESCYKVNHLGEKVDMMKEFKNDEFLPYPVVSHDDGLDGLAYINDIDFKQPGAARPRRRLRARTIVPIRANASFGQVWSAY